MNSYATVKLITSALSRLSRNTRIGRAEALRELMLALIDGSEDQLVYPDEWAPFAVVGEGSAMR